MTAIPTTHITDAQQLQADGVVELFELSPNVGGVLYFKNGAEATWQGNLYASVPCAITELKRSADNVSSQPRLTIGEQNIDLSAFKPLLFDGAVDGGTLLYRRVLLAHLVANTNIKHDQTFRIKRLEGYSRMKIIMGLSSSSDGMNFTLPNLQYYPPAFPAVAL